MASLEGAANTSELIGLRADEKAPNVMFNSIRSFPGSSGLTASWLNIGFGNHIMSEGIFDDILSMEHNEYSFIP